MAKALQSLSDTLTPDSAQISAIRQDLKNLRNDAADLKDDLVKVGSEQARKASSVAVDQLKEAKKTASNKFASAEVYVRDNPGQSVAMAFLAGALVSLFFGGRR